MANNVQGQVAVRTAADYLRQPYMRLVIPQADGTYHAEILEFPGCIATGTTAADAHTQLEEVAESWVEVALQAGRSIPPAMDQSDFSGKTVVRMPRNLHRKATFAAQREGVSLNQFIVACVAEGVGAATRSLSVAGNIFNVHQINVLKLELGATAGKTLPQLTQGKRYAGH